MAVCNYDCEIKAKRSDKQKLNWLELSNKPFSRPVGDRSAFVTGDRDSGMYTSLKTNITDTD